MQNMAKNRTLQFTMAASVVKYGRVLPVNFIHLPLDLLLLLGIIIISLIISILLLG